MKMKQPINEIKRMQQLAGIINEETTYTSDQIAKALKDLTINAYHTIDDEEGKDWVVTICGEEKVWRFEESDAKIVKAKIEKSKKLLGAKINVVNTKTGEISAT